MPKFKGIYGISHYLLHMLILGQQVYCFMAGSGLIRYKSVSLTSLSVHEIIDQCRPLYDGTPYTPLSCSICQIKLLKLKIHTVQNASHDSTCIHSNCSVYIHMLCVATVAGR